MFTLHVPLHILLGGTAIATFLAGKLFGPLVSGQSRLTLTFLDNKALGGRITLHIRALAWVSLLQSALNYLALVILAPQS